MFANFPRFTKNASYLRLVCGSILLFLICIDYTLPYKVESEKDALAYLLNYGYVDSQVMPRGFTLKDCDKKLKEFQKMSRVPVTGELDEATMKAMNTPRCGCPDFIQLSFNGNSDEVLPSDENDSRKETGSKWKWSQSNHTHNHNHHNRRHHHHHHHRHPHHHNSRHNQTIYRQRSKRFAISEQKWKGKIVTYNIAKYPSRRDIKISQTEIEDAIHKAFNIWEQHINLDFSYQPNNVEADIEISFVRGHHGDSYPFDGPGKTLAHAFFPGRGIGGDVHFEEDEDWRVGVYNGIDILHVAVHELGHSLGLGHSSEYGAVMYPMYRGYIPNLELHSDDILGVQALYGRKFDRVPIPPSITSTTARPLPAPTTRRTIPTTATTTVRNWNNATVKTTTLRPSYNELCTEERIDAIATLYDDTILVFQGGNVYEIGKNKKGILPGWPKPIRSYFRGVEDNLDCVLTRSNGKTYFFKKFQYWRFTGRRMDRGYPRAIADYFPGIPNNLDAAFEWDDEFVFIKGNQFWRFNTKKRPQVERYFPMPISHWGLTKRLDAAFTSTNGSVYFFQGLYYWKFDNESHKIINDGQWPGLVTEDWFGCKEP